MSDTFSAPKGAGAPDENDPVVRVVARMLSEWDEGEELAREFSVRIVNAVKNFGAGLEQ
jgi:hypothetical protein